jgi:hypothetical protein
VADILVEAHSFLRWAVLAVLVIGGAAALMAAPRGTEFDRKAYGAAVAVIDLQVLLGVVLYIWNQGWGEGLFIAVIHPLGMLAAAAVAHFGVARGAREDDVRAHQIVGVSFLIALGLVALAIPWERAAA